MPFDFTAVSAPFRMQPGLRRLAPGAQQLTPNAPGDAALVEKLAVLTNDAGRALLQVDGFDATPLLRTLAEQAASEHPQAFAVDAAGHWHARRLGWSLVDGDEPAGTGAESIGTCLRALPVAWRRAALLALAFAEDFAIIDGRNGRVPWLAVCLPSHWAPEDKVGLHFAQVHAPVADNQVLITASDHLARLVTGEQRWERFVWTITPRAALDQHPARCRPAPWAADADAEALAAQAFFRTERQTFIPMPAQSQAVFTIHVEMQPLAEALQRPDDARQLHDALASMTPAVLAYRGLTDARDRLVRWLAGRACA